MHLLRYCQLIKNCFCIKPQEFNLEDMNAVQGWVSSGRNPFLPGHLEETGKNWKKVVFSTLFRKKVEEIGIK